MQVHYSFKNLPEIASPVVTVGSFDGVHVGHRVIIGRLNDLAEEAGGSSVLITFHPHPRKVLYPETAGKDLKLIPPEGAYAVSFLHNGAYSKGLILIREGKLFSFQLETESSIRGGEGVVRFHKRVAGAGETDLPVLLEEVRELIY